MPQEPPTDPTAGVTRAVTERRRLPRGLVVTAALLLLGLLLAEGGVRLIDDRLRPPLEWHSWEAQTKVEQMEALELTNDGVHIVGVGTSAMHFGLDARQLERELGSGRVAYNAALPGGVPRMMELWTREVVLPRLHPTVLLVSVNSADLNDNGPSQDQFYDFFRSSPAARHLSGDETWLERIDRRFGSWSTLWRFRAVIRRPADLIRSIRGEEIARPGEPVGPGGLGLSRQSAKLEATPRRVTAFIERRRRTWLRNFSIDGIEAGALLRLVQDARAQGIAVVLVEMPVTTYYQQAHPNGQADIDAFHRTIDQIVERTGAVFIDASRVAPRDDLFGDFVHLNGEGAKIFTSFVAQRLRELGLV